MTNFIKYSTLVATGFVMAACGTLHEPSKTNNCPAECERNYSAFNVEYQRCMATCKAADPVSTDGVVALPSSVDRPSSNRAN
jgi:hypothetical protein